MLGFIDAPIDRAAILRGDDNWLDQKLSSQESKVIIFADDRPAIDVSGSQLKIATVTPGKAFEFVTKQQSVLLNLSSAGDAVFAVDVGTQNETEFADNTTKFIDLRSLAKQGALIPADLGALAQARSLLSWHANHQYCAGCGKPTTPIDAGYARKCSACERQHFPRVDPVVIMLVRHKDRFLLGRGHNFPEFSYSALAGFLEPGETIEAATQRETFEETGVQIGKVKYLMSQPWPFPSTLMIGVIAEALTEEIILDDKEIQDARWFSKAELVQMRNKTHPQALIMPPPMSIAYQLVGEFVQD